MANASSEGAAGERERPAQQSPSSSLGSSLLARAVGFVVAMFAIGFGIDILIVPLIGDSEMIQVIIAIFLCLGLITILLTVLAGVLALVRRVRR
ncbi:hypothetical protein [Halomarina oriensis]|uniref:Uncharacterized protein n=1 Tax=Halomarina oriensis TaxID=671145 RepID=A0A6B0GSJ5_9EURY|nr:hypothetical protein [Halomarina oriensis]MWG35603.1 hypothetical protein [Halomarina oriensis]